MRLTPFWDLAFILHGLSINIISVDKKNTSIFKKIIGVFIDRFGKDISIRPSKAKGWFETTVEVAMSDIFLGWIFALGNKVKIIGPKGVVKSFEEEIQERINLYKDRVLTMENCNRGNWIPYPFLMPEHISDNRKNSSKNGGLYYSGIWQELVVYESDGLMEWVKSVLK